MSAIRHILPSAVVALAVAASACTSSRAWFRPGENSGSESPGGFPAASYDVGRDSQAAGQVTVWSEGARLDDRGMTVVRVGFEIENWSGAEVELVLAETDLRAVQTGSDLFEDLPYSAMGGNAVVPDQKVGRVDLEFTIPEAWLTGPEDIASFHVRWLLLGKEIDALRQLTPFRRDVRRYYGPYYYGPYYGRSLWWGPYPYGCWW